MLGEERLVVAYGAQAMKDGGIWSTYFSPERDGCNGKWYAREGRGVDPGLTGGTWEKV